MPVRLSIEIANELKSKIRRDAEIRVRSREFAYDVANYWVEEEAPAPWHPSGRGSRPETVVGHPDEWPYTTGDYGESIHVRRQPDHLGMPHYWVGTHSPIAHFIEFGTGPDAPGTHSPWGPDTPTFEYAPAARTAFHFGGTAP